MARRVARCPKCGTTVPAEVLEAVTVPEAAVRMGVTEQTIRNWIEGGRLPHATKEKIPGGFRWWIQVSDLEALEESAA